MPLVPNYANLINFTSTYMAITHNSVFSVAVIQATMVYDGIVYTLFSLFLIYLLTSHLEQNLECLPWPPSFSMTSVLLSSQQSSHPCSLCAGCIGLLSVSTHLEYFCLFCLWPWGSFLLRSSFSDIPWPVPQVLLCKDFSTTQNPHILPTSFFFFFFKKFLPVPLTCNMFYLSPVYLLKCKHHEDEHYGCFNLCWIPSTWSSS